MNKKVFTGFIALVLISGVATAQDTIFEDFEDTESEFNLTSDHILDIDTYYDDYFNSQNQSFFHEGRDNDGYTDFNIEAYNVSEVSYNYGLWSETAENRGRVALIDSNGSEVFYMRNTPYVDNQISYDEYILQIGNNEKYIVLTPQDKAETSYTNLNDGQFLNTSIKFMDNGSMNITVDASGSSYNTLPEYLNYSTDDIQAVRVYSEYDADGYDTSVDNLEVKAEEFGIRDYADYYVTIPLPRLADSLGLPFGTLLLVNAFVGLLALIVALIPDFVFRGLEAFQDYVGGVVTTAQSTLTLATEYMAWIQEIGVKRLKEIVTILGIIALVRYGSVLKEGVNGERSMIGAVEWIASDLIGKAESIERIIYRATDTMTNIVSLGFYLLEMVLKVYRTAKNHLPVIG